MCVCEHGSACLCVQVSKVQGRLSSSLPVTFHLIPLRQKLELRLSVASPSGPSVSGPHSTAQVFIVVRQMLSNTEPSSSPLSCCVFLKLFSLCVCMYIYMMCVCVCVHIHLYAQMCVLVGAEDNLSCFPPNGVSH